MSILALVVIKNSDANHPVMTKTDSRRGKVTQEHIEEAELLRDLWHQTYEERKKRGLHSQGAFGEEYQIGNQAAVGFFLNGKTALSLKAAKGFAKGLGCEIAEFSERLAILESSWPFELIDREAYESLPKASQYQVQTHMMDEIREILQKHASPEKTTSGAKAA